jgi:glycosyltransferase involved in cell wall biosynthesis
MIIVPNHSVFQRGDFIALEVAEVELIEVLRKDRERIVIAAFEETAPDTSAQGKLPIGDGIDFAKLNVVSHSNALLNKILNYLSVVFTAPLRLGREPITYVFCPSHCAVIVCLWAIILRRKYGLYVRGTWLRRDGSTPWVWQQIFYRALFIVATGETFRQKLLAFNDNVLNQRPMTKFEIEEPGEECLRRSNRIRDFIFVGRITESKGVLDAVKAVTMIRKEHGHDIRMAIAGGGTIEEEEMLRETIHECNAAGYVSWLGNVTKLEVLRECYLSADALVLPTYYPEGFPRVLYEAMMFSLPIITTDLPGTHGILLNEKNCLICKPRDLQNLAGCMLRFVDAPQFAAELGEAGYDYVSELFQSFEHSSHAEAVSSAVNRLISLTAES